MRCLVLWRALSLKKNFIDLGYVRSAILEPPEVPPELLGTDRNRFWSFGVEDGDDIRCDFTFLESKWRLQNIRPISATPPRKPLLTPV